MRKIWLVAAGAVLLVGGVAVGCDGGTSSSGAGETSAAKGSDKSGAAASKANEPEDDVELTKCGTDDSGMFPQAELTVTNRSSKTSNYLISVEFTDEAGTRKGEGTAALNNLAPDQRAEEKAVGLSDAPSGLKCKITKVTRYAS
ncbi:FxLYD domain-containing protein [Streptomyces pilosus]|uniref:Lipoprotein n=2 Tax=Streptomyces pilosus TaxID=28893 RepID=A0A918BHV9_9ACTN|nr:FxLYD domain-containing protein [Streptomyces pilosus]GGQ70122.1 hypothetical protein GCM10010280_15690 [Streptomyces pilosus]GGV55036.1 hypothetical protein GCM10010261_38580 [Streptomyces pilosus]